MSEIKEKAWEVFRSVFKEGEDVLVEDETGTWYWGKLSWSKDELILTTLHGKSERIIWEKAELICHDGFPVKPIMGMTADYAAMLAALEPREVVIAAWKKTMGPLRAMDLGKETRPTYKWNSGGGGCPFVMGPCHLVEIHNEGNTGPIYDEYPMTEIIENMVFQAPDGAIMHSYDSTHLFMNIP